MSLRFPGPARATFGHVFVAAAVVAAMLLAGCGDKKNKPASQTAAKVNKEEITVHQINFVLQQQRGLKPEQADAASKEILERLIGQELAVQKADELKLDRDPRVLQQLEASKRDILARAYLERLIDQQLALQKADEQKVDRDPRVVQALEASRREIIARAYLEKVGEAAAKPTPEEIKKYYDDKPALFSQRRIYNIQEIIVEAKPEQVTELREQLSAAKNINEFVEYLKAKDYRFAGNQAVRAAEQLPLQSLDAFGRMKDGQAMLVPQPNGVQVIVVAGTRSQPLSEEQARPVIEQYLLNDRKRKLAEEDIKALRGAAKIEYVGKFAEGAASAPAATAPVAPAPTGSAPAADITKLK